MPDIAHFMTDEHRECDRLFAAAESAVAAGDWNEAAARFEQQHDMKEEQVLYPMSDQALGDADSVLGRMKEL